MKRKIGTTKSRKDGSVDSYKLLRNQAFVDGQNLYYSTNYASDAWKVDLKRFRVYLREKYLVDKAYYFIGAADEAHQELYQLIQESGFILVFRLHSLEMMGHKKGNVDTDIVFSVMRKIAEKEDFDKIILVSGDGDYCRMVEYLVSKDRFMKLLSPSREALSSLYRPLVPKFVDFLDGAGVKRKIRQGK